MIPKPLAQIGSLLALSGLGPSAEGFIRLLRPRLRLPVS